MSLRDELAEILREKRDYAPDGIAATDAFAALCVRVLMPSIEREIAKARDEGWQRGFADGFVGGAQVERGDI